MKQGLIDFWDGFKKGLKLFGEAISSIINIILLSGVYLLGVGLTSLIAKLFSNRFLNLKPDKNLDSYWKASSPIKKEEFYRQF